jgi:hypothetical protein
VTDAAGVVVLTSSDDTVLAALGEHAATTLRRAYWVRGDRDGYVHEITDGRPGTLGQQVCDRLSHGGSTLHCCRARLAAVVRYELRAALRAHLREVR